MEVDFHFTLHAGNGIAAKRYGKTMKLKECLDLRLTLYLIPSPGTCRVCRFPKVAIRGQYGRFFHSLILLPVSSVPGGDPVDPPLPESFDIIIYQGHIPLSIPISNCPRFLCKSPSLEIG